jgi:transcriptional regulator with XRE-family HTH domain
LLVQESLWWLASATVTNDDEELHAQRLGYWLRRVRLRRNESLKSAAIAAGLKASSGSTVSLWERGKRPITVKQLRRLAIFYGVPEDFFTMPPMTDEERLSAALSDAATLERDHWALGEGTGPEDDAEPDAGRRRPLQ